MAKLFISLSSTMVALAITASAANAHIIPWRTGESRQIGWGHCAKGACMKRYVWAENKPHRHVGKKLVYLKIASPGEFYGTW